MIPFDGNRVAVARGQYLEGVDWLQMGTKELFKIIELFCVMIKVVDTSIKLIFKIICCL